MTRSSYVTDEKPTGDRPSALEMSPKKPFTPSSNLADSDPVLPLLDSKTERERYRTLLTTLALWKSLFVGRRVLDFGASWGTSMVALIRLEAAEVVGVEPSLARVEKGRELLAKAVPGASASVIHKSETTSLPFADGEFEFILANGVLEHIPQPRDAHVRELWRTLVPGGYLMINETPNKYFPKEVHTTSLWFNHWLPRRLAHSRAMRRRRFDPNRSDWNSSGWRGLGYFELVRSITGYRLVPEQTRFRHRLLRKVGLPSSLIDPYPTWILQKVRPGNSGDANQAQGDLIS